MANTLLDLFEKNHQLLEWRDKVTLLSRQLVMGFSGSSKAVVMASALSEQVPKILIVTSTQNEAEQLIGDLSAILGEDKVYSFFADDVVAAEFIFSSPEKTHSRLESLNFLMDKEASGVLVMSLVGTKLHLPNPKVYKDSRIDLTLGEEHDLEDVYKRQAIIGQNDIQTTALIRALADDIDYEGTIKWGVTTSRSYLPKDNSKDFASGESILEWLRQFAEKGEDDDTFLRGFLGRMLFSGDEVNKSVSVLSGGEKVRVMLSKLMLLKSNVLLLDDPTNHLDLESISSLNDGVRDFKESVIFASHDHEFIQTIANHIVVVSKNGVIDRIDETYDEFLENEEVQAKVKALWAD